MYLIQQAKTGRVMKSPHKRGDVPGIDACGYARIAISPQAWGCTVGRLPAPKWFTNLPTSVGMYRATVTVTDDDEESPHKRGDVPM